MDWIQRIESDYQSEGHTIHLVDEALSLAASALQLDRCGLSVFLRILYGEGSHEPALGAQRRQRSVGSLASTSGDCRLVAGDKSGAAVISGVVVVNGGCDDTYIGQAGPDHQFGQSRHLNNISVGRTLRFGASLLDAYCGLDGNCTLWPHR